jgi:uncharacterized repeat protein (TIGR04138 family)
MTATQQPIELQKLLASGPYPIDAYEFVQAGLAHTQGLQFIEDGGLSHEQRHVDGQQLCEGLRDLAITRWGLLAPTVLKRWHIQRTDDFGRIVFGLIEAGVMSGTDEDSMEDFRSVFDFRTAFSSESMNAELAASPR